MMILSPRAAVPALVLFAAVVTFPSPGVRRRR